MNLNHSTEQKPSDIVNMPETYINYFSWSLRIPSIHLILTVFYLSKDQNEGILWEQFPEVNLHLDRALD